MASRDTGGDQAYDLLLVTDATFSMNNFLAGLNQSLTEIISISALTSCFERIGVVAYRDYSEKLVTEWSGWCCPSGSLQGPELVSQDDVLKMAKRITPDGGGDIPEAAKTGLACAYSKMRPEAITLILFYTDAPPHFQRFGSENRRREYVALTSSKFKYSPADRELCDWAKGARLLRDGPKKAVVFPIIKRHTSESAYLFLSTITGGCTFALRDLTANTISRLTVNLLLTWMRLGKTVQGGKENLRADVVRYKLNNEVERITAEADAAFPKVVAVSLGAEIGVHSNIAQEKITFDDFPQIIKARGPKMAPFAQKYANDANYKRFAVEQLRRIITFDVGIISVNPIFGSLWRAVCSDRLSEHRDELVDLFSQQIQKISDSAQKAKLNSWLEESYNYAEEVNELINKVPGDVRFPLLYQDPTEVFPASSATFDGDSSGSSFTRKELLEIGRSCDYKVLRRIGTALTRLRVAESPEELPRHISFASTEVVPQIPTILATSEYGRKFWKVLLHAILPGMMLSDRAAALLAALSLRMGISHLRNAADAELLHYRSRWNTLEIPETWSVGCLSLILEADRDYEKRVSDGITKRTFPGSRILSEADRDLFKTLVDYKILELNLDTTLRPLVAWQPYKNKSALGPLVVCTDCKFPRSVTVMAKNGVCGICAVLKPSSCSCTACLANEDHETARKANVSHDTTSAAMAHWVECRKTDCRAQYVVYNVDLLGVKSKCYFCRHGGEKRRGGFGRAPLVECCKCLSRIIWPREYRPEGFDTTTYECSACTSGVKTVVECESSARTIASESGFEWLVRNDGGVLDQLFAGKSVFGVASTCNREHLTANLRILPDMDVHLTVSGRTIHNVGQVQQTLKEWVYARRAERDVCSLCFEDKRKNTLVRACGRKGCEQMICGGCRQDWYGINQRGHLINIAALSCPFCRRQPARNAISSFPFTALQGLQTAIEENAEWIYAWCTACDVSKRHMERVCANGAPEELRDWNCEECVLSSDPGKAGLKPRPCPECGVMTQKTSGCNHITCPCGVHWCYVCGEQSAERDIYKHISTFHDSVAWVDFMWQDDDLEDEDGYN